MIVKEFPNGDCIVEVDGEIILYTNEEIAEMERDYIEAIKRLLTGSGPHKGGEPHANNNRSK